MRYAATSASGAARERYRDTGSFIPASHATHFRVDLNGVIRVLDLRREVVLDALGVDARICSSYEEAVRSACWQLCDSVVEWWGDAVQGILSTSRTTPESSANLAFFAHTPLTSAATPLADCGPYLDELVIGHGFTVDFR